jgi:hypothetical protein
MANTIEHQLEGLQNILKKNISGVIQQLLEIHGEASAGTYFDPSNLDPNHLFTPHFLNNSDSALSNIIGRAGDNIEELHQMMKVFQGNDAIIHLVLEMDNFRLDYDGRGWDRYTSLSKLECIYLCCLEEGTYALNQFLKFIDISKTVKHQWFEYFESNYSTYSDEISAILTQLRVMKFKKIVKGNNTTPTKELVWTKAKRVEGMNSDVLRELACELNTMEDFENLKIEQKTVQLKLNRSFRTDYHWAEVSAKDVFNSCVAQSWDGVVRNSEVRFQIVSDFFSERLTDIVN